MANTRDLRAKLERLKGQRDQLQRTITALTDQLRLDKRQASRVRRALEIVKGVGIATQQQLEYHLTEQVSLAMEAVFDAPYRLAVHFEEKRGRTEVALMFARNDMEFPPIGSAGGGTIDVAAFALRVAYWSMRRDKAVASILLLDEPFSQLKGEDANRRALAIVQELSHKLHLQILMVSDERVPRDDIIHHADHVYLAQKDALHTTLTLLEA
jgi:DNA repair exonuclease SbcCD ATPase subunit